MFHKIVSVKPIDDLRLQARFDTGEVKTYNVAPLQSRLPIFESLTTVPGLFNQVQVDEGGYGISWNEDIDLSSDEIWRNGEDETDGHRI